MKVVVGLGNPEAKYAATKHNVGYDWIEIWSDEVDGQGAEVHLIEANLKLPIFSSRIGEVEVVAFQPQIHINSSGAPIKAFCDAFEVPASDLIVVADDMDLPVGEFQIQHGKISSRHNGIKDIVKKFGSDFIWVRIGIDKPNGNNKWLEHVLSPFQDRTQIDAALRKAVIATKEMIKNNE